GWGHDPRDHVLDHVGGASRCARAPPNCPAPHAGVRMTGELATQASFRDYLNLTKPRLSLLSVLTAVVGYFATRPENDPVKFLLLLIGTSLAAGGVAALNQWMESDTDAQMKRTAD